MEVSVPLSPSALASLFICFASCGLAAVFIHKSKSVTIESAIEKRTILKKNVNRCNGSMGAKIFIPNTLARWPWRRLVNPNYSVLRMEADAWINNFQAFSPKAQDAFNRCDFNLLACLAYPTASKEHARVGCDLMHFLFVVDEHSDWSVPSEVREQKSIVLDALQNPHLPRPRGEWIGGEIARQFWELNMRSATKVSQRRFIQYMDEYLESVVHESINRNAGRILDIKTYIDIRRRTSAAKPSFSIIELGFDIPDEVMSHPAIQQMMLTAIELIALHNDICSYNVEQHRGDDLHNIITVVMNEYDTDVNGAILWAEDHIHEVEESFHAARAALPQWEEPLNSQVKEYCDGVGHWVRANDDWNFECERYLGDRGLEIKEKKWMSLLPKQRATEIGPVHVDSSLL